jgi:hypothetical protein
MAVEPNRALGAWALVCDSRLRGNPGATGASSPMLSADGVASGATRGGRGAGAADDVRVAILVDGRHIEMLRLAGAVLVLSAAALGSSSCAGAARPPRRADPQLVARIQPTTSGTSVLAGPPDVVAAGMAHTLFSSAPVVVVADAGRPADVSAASARAGRAHAPLLLTMGATVGTATRAEIGSLHPRAVLAVGVDRTALAAQLGGTRVVTRPAALPTTSAPPPLGHLVVLVQRGSAAAKAAAVTTARVAGAQVITVHGFDPRADPAAISALSAARPRRVIALGAGFGPVRPLQARLAVAETGVQLPGGGQVLFPMRRLVALYGHPGTPALGALGEQDLPASIARAKMIAARYRRLSNVPVIPAFEIIATVAERSPGGDGSYSSPTPLASLWPWVQRASAAGMYVVLDLQAGRASLLTQAKGYERLLELPNVGLALDPEWKLQPGQRPLRQIGNVNASEINSVSNWLSSLTARHHLPQKLLVLHQFRLSMIGNESGIDTRHDNVAIIIHMDGQGTPTEKQQTWQAVTGAAPRRVFLGWKNFYAKDHPMLSPRQTMARIPKPMMISYQ